MNLTTNKKGTSSSDSLFLGLIIFVGLVVAYLFYSSHTPNLPSSLAPKKEPEISFERLKLNFKLLDKISEQGLITYGELPIRPASGGKDDLFAPTGQGLGR